MLRKKVANVICLLFIINFLSAQEINRTLYQETTIWEIRNRRPSSIPDFIEYFRANVMFIRSFTLSWRGELWEVEDINAEASFHDFHISHMEPAPNLLMPKEGQIVTIFFRWVPEIGSVIDYWLEAGE